MLLLFILIEMFTLWWVTMLLYLHKIPIWSYLRTGSSLLTGTHNAVDMWQGVRVCVSLLWQCVFLVACSYILYHSTVHVITINGCQWLDHGLVSGRWLVDVYLCKCEHYGWWCVSLSHQHQLYQVSTLYLPMRYTAIHWYARKKKHFAIIWHLADSISAPFDLMTKSINILVMYFCCVLYQTMFADQLVGPCALKHHIGAFMVCWNTFYLNQRNCSSCHLDIAVGHIAVQIILQ